MAAPGTALERYTRTQRMIQWLTRAYLIRFPLLTAAAMVLIPYAAFFTGARSLLENLFDLAPVAIMLVTMTALITGDTSDPRLAEETPGPEQQDRDEDHEDDGEGLHVLVASQLRRA